MKLSLIPDIKDAWSFSTFWVGTFFAIFGQLSEERQVGILTFLGASQADALSIAGILFVISRLTQVTRK